MVVIIAFYFAFALLLLFFVCSIDEF